ncbi:MAG: filamentous hemagglutinin family protein [Thermodesulfobacteriota bacterium]|nr:filamentous hemagglutinin family protein [Thermodesulfobacteriota bacterium]
MVVQNTETGFRVPIPQQARPVLMVFMIIMLMMGLSPQPVLPATLYGANNGVFTGVGSPSSTALPVPMIDGPEWADIDDDNHKLTVHQEDASALFEWESFDIGENAWTHFDQQGQSNWVALNRIYDASPSQILGRLSADGKIFLINQNGILFGQNARVNVHSLIASSLNIDDYTSTDLTFSAEDYREVYRVEQGIAEEDWPEDLFFYMAGTEDGGEIELSGPVYNYAGSGSDDDSGIYTDEAGSVFLIAPNVENHGIIDAPYGQIGLVAGCNVEVVTKSDRTYPCVLVNDYDDGRPLLVNPELVGNALNGDPDVIMDDPAMMSADSGVVGMYGRSLTQSGMIRSVTAVKKGGTIELHASDSAYLTKGSLTVCPIDDDTETYHESFGGEQGEIYIRGLGSVSEDSTNTDAYVFEASATGLIVHQGEIIAPSGLVQMTATDQIYLDSGSLIDVSGEWVTLSAEDAVYSLQLNSVELKNDYNQKDGTLQGEEINIIGYVGTDIGDLSSALTSQYLSAQGMNTTGGQITISGLMQGDTVLENLQEIVIRDGAVLNIAGGGNIYNEGFYESTKLLAGNRIYDISEAPAWLAYDKVLGYHSVANDRYGLIDEYYGFYLGGANPVMDYIPAHVEGHDAGELNLVARGIAFNGSLIGSVAAGYYQTDVEIPEEQFGDFYLEYLQGTRMPRGGRLTIGVSTTASDPDPIDEYSEKYYDYDVDEVVIAAESTPLPEDFAPGDDIRGETWETLFASPFLSDDGEFLYRTILSTNMLNQSGLSDLRIYTNTQVTIAEDANITLNPGGYLLDDSVDYQPSWPVTYFQNYGYGDYPATLNIFAAAFENQGTITMPDGRVYVALQNTTANEVLATPLNNRVYLGENSTISVAGDRLDNLNADLYGDYETGFIDGGDIVIADETSHGGDMIVRHGAILDVSAGYERDMAGGLIAGEAGSLELTANTMVLDGDLRGYGLPGNDGGTITLHAGYVTIAAPSRSTLPDDFDVDRALPQDDDWEWHINEADDTAYAGLVVAYDRFSDTGFTAINLRSYDDLIFEDVENGIVFTPSDVKLAPPDLLGEDETLTISLLSAYGIDLTADSVALLDQGLIRVGAQYQGNSSGISATAGKKVALFQDDAFGSMPEEDRPQVIVPANTTLQVAIGGDITLSSPGTLTLEGSLIALGGDVSLSATADGADVVLADNSKILVNGAAIPETTALMMGLPINHTLFDAGTVSLSASQGSVDIMEKAEVDVSGSNVVTNYVLDANGLPVAETIGSNGGGLEVTFRDKFLFNSSTINGQAHVEDSHGASLEIFRKQNPLTIDATIIEEFQGKGFDGFGFASEEEILFADSMTLDAGRYFTLDAPLVTAESGNVDVNITATRITLSNTNEKFSNSYYLEDRLVSDNADLDAGNGNLIIAGEWIDLEGAVAVQGFETVSLSAGQDMQVLDEKYAAHYNLAAKEGQVWKGLLKAAGALTLDAARIYPVMKSVVVNDSTSSVNGETFLTPTAFTFLADSGPVNIQSSGFFDDSPIYSAGGVLAVVAPEINQNGYLAAPMGQIALVTSPLVEVDGEMVPARELAITSEDGQYKIEITSNIADENIGDLIVNDLALGANSITTTSSNIAVEYGLLQGETWQSVDKNQSMQALTSAITTVSYWPDIETVPEKGISLQATDILVADSALLDSSGGGSIYGRQFMPGINGLENPLEVDDRYVIVPGVSKYGEAVYLIDDVALDDGAILAAGEYSILSEEYAFLPGAYIIEDRDTTTELVETAMTQDGYPAVPGYETTAGADDRDSQYHLYAVRTAADVLAEGEFSIAQSLDGSAGLISIKGRTVDLNGTLIMDSLDYFQGGVLEVSGCTMAVGDPTVGFEADFQLNSEILAGLDLEKLYIGDATLTSDMATQEIRLYEGGLHAAKVILAAAGDVIFNDDAEILATEDSPQVSNVTLQYTLNADDAGNGLNAFSLTDIIQSDDTETVTGTLSVTGIMTRRTGDGDIPLDFILANNTLAWNIASEDLDLAPDRFDAGVNAPYGAATLVSEAGVLTLLSGSRVHATDEVILDGVLDLQGGVLSADNSALQLRGDAILFVPEGFTGDPSRGLYLTDSMWGDFNTFETITLNSATDLVFLGDHDIATEEKLILNAQRIIGLEPTEFQALYPDANNQSQVTLASDAVYLTNTGEATEQPGLTVYEADGAEHPFASLDDTGILTVNAGSSLFLDPGIIQLDGFETASLNSSGDIVFCGEGMLMANQAVSVTMDAVNGLSVAPYRLDTEALAARASKMTLDEITAFIEDNLRMDVSTNGRDLADIREDLVDDIETWRVSTYEQADYQILANQAAVTIFGGDTVLGDLATVGGKLTITGHTIDHHGGFYMPGGSLVMDALADSAAQGITLHEGSWIDATGGELAYTVGGENFTYAYAGGSVDLTAETGTVIVEDGALVDVSADAGQDAGSITLIAPEYGAAINGAMRGTSDTGKGGAFALYTDQLSENELGGLGADLSDNGFTSDIIVHTRFGNLSLAASDALVAHHIKLVADDRNDDGNGNITIIGQLDASAEGTRHADGGSVELYAWNDLTVSGAVDVSSDAGEGGEVYLSAGNNSTDDEAGALIFDGAIDVSGGAIGDDGEAANGNVHFRAYRDSGDAVDMTLIGTITGAERITAETVEVYTSLSTAQSHLSDDPATVDFDALTRGDTETHAQSGIEVRSTGNLTVSGDWDLTNISKTLYAVDEVPGILTIRSAGDLTMSSDLLDYYDPENLTDDPMHAYYGLSAAFPEQYAQSWTAWTFDLDALEAELPVEEWGFQFNFDRIASLNWHYNLVAGADLESADIMATVDNSGDLNVDDHMIYTQYGDIQFASGKDMYIGDGAGSYMLHQNLVYNLGTFCGSMQGEVKGRLVFEGDLGAIQSAIGDIDLYVGEDLDLPSNKGNAIRTTGNYPIFSGEGIELLAQYGGDISLAIGGDIMGGKTIALEQGGRATGLQFWDHFYDRTNDSGATGQNFGSWWSADYGYDDTATAGIATMAGGDVSVVAGGNIMTQIGTFKEGDLTVMAGGDLGGLFQVGSGEGVITALGNMDSQFEQNNLLQFETSLALLDGSAKMAAQGNMNLGTVFNPTLAPGNVDDAGNDDLISQVLTYDYETPSSVSVSAVHGDILVWGYYTAEGAQYPAVDYTYRVLPPQVTMAAGGDIRLKEDMALAPSATGNLSLFAGDDITTWVTSATRTSRTGMYISDLDPTVVYGYEAGLQQQGGMSYRSPGEVFDMFAPHYLTDAHASGMILHANDPDPVTIHADGSITELMIHSPKAMDMMAGLNIEGLFLMVQHTTALSLSTVSSLGVSADTTYIRANGDIDLESEIQPITTFYQGGGALTDNYAESGFHFSGPGYFLVQAGNDIDLGVTQGIFSVGDTYNTILPVSETAAGAGALAVVAGLFKEMNLSTIQTFFQDLQEGGEAFSALQAEGEAAAAQAMVDQIETETILPFFDGGDLGQGNIYMAESQIAAKGETSSAILETEVGGQGQYACSSSIYLVARGNINVGETAMDAPGTGEARDTGIYTALGGDIKIFSMGDINVNESRVMTFRGGDILAWSHAGDINAGRGARTAVNADPPVVNPVYKKDGDDYLYRCKECDEESHEKLEMTEAEWAGLGYETGNLSRVVDYYEVAFTPPAVGSGIRALTYDPDGVEGPKSAPLLGDAYLFAPSGIIDAGEAGIAARNVTLAAVEVLNVQNIEVAGVSVGVPNTTAGASLGALSGTSDVSDAGDMAAQTTDMAAESAAEARKRMQELEKSLQEAFLGLDVKVVLFEDLDV